MRVLKIIFTLVVIGFIAVFISEILRAQDIKVEKAIKLTEICPGVIIVQASTPLLGKGLKVTCSYTNTPVKAPIKQKKWSV